MAKKYTQAQLEAGAERLLNDIFPERSTKMEQLRKEEKATEMTEEQSKDCFNAILRKLGL